MGVDVHEAGVGRCVVGPGGREEFVRGTEGVVVERVGNVLGKEAGAWEVAASVDEGTVMWRQLSVLGCDL